MKTLEYFEQDSTINFKTFKDININEYFYKDGIKFYKINKRSARWISVRSIIKFKDNESVIKSL